MREHEVPTHVQAEDRVLLWFTFPQVVAMTAVCALSYGAYRYAPVGPSEVRMAIAVLLGLAGLVAVVGKIGGRRLPLVAADLLKYRLGARLYAGPPSELVRSEPPAPAQPVKSGPRPLRLMARRAGRILRRLHRKRGSRERTGGRMPFRPHRWFGKPRRTDRDSMNGNANGDGGRKARRSKSPKSFLAVAAVVALAAAVATVPQSALADGHEPWRDEIDFEITEPVEGRKIFVEGLSVSGDRAAVTLRAATALDIRVRAFGGPQGTWLRFWGSASLNQGEQIDYSLPLHGPRPSFTVSWEDTLGQAGAVTVESEQIPYPLPDVEGALCDLRMTSLGWTSGAVEGVIKSECVSTIEHPVELQTVAGHESVTETALMDAQVTAITGTVAAATGSSHASVPFVPGGETRFRLPVGDGRAIHAVNVDVSLEASLSIPIPPLTRLRDEVQRGRERLFHSSLSITLHARDEASLKEMTQRARGHFAATLGKLDPLAFRQREGILSTLPLGLNAVAVWRTLDTSSLARLFPFSPPDLDTRRGTLYGIDMRACSPVVYDPWDGTHLNANTAVLARSGSGKSFATKLGVLRGLTRGVTAYVIDPEGEYADMARAAGGRVLSPGVPGQGMNPFVIDTGDSEELLQRIGSLRRLIEVMVGESLGADRRASLDHALAGYYATSRERTGFRDFYKYLQESDAGDPDPESSSGQALARLLRPFATGSLRNLLSDEGDDLLGNEALVTVFDLRLLEPELRPAAAMVCTETVWAAAAQDPKPRLLVVDEVWSIMQHPEGAAFMVSMAKRARKHRLGLQFIT